VRVDAKPEPLSIDIARCVVIVVDMTNDLGSRGGMFDRAGIDILHQVFPADPAALGPGRRPWSMSRGPYSDHDKSLLQIEI
jgi:hypothetical protein